MHTVQLILKPTEYEKLVINKSFHALSHIHNVCVKHAKKQLAKLDRDSEYQSWRSDYCKIIRKKELSKTDKARKEKLSEQMNMRRQETGLSSPALQAYIKVCGKRYNKLLSSQQIQAGNSICVPVLECIFKELHNMDLI